MLSIEEIRLLREKLEKLKATDWEKFLDEQINTLKTLESAVDGANIEMIQRLDKTVEWFRKDLEYKRLPGKSEVDDYIYKIVQTKIFQFAKTNLYNSLEIGPGNGIFSKEFRAWRKNFFLDVIMGVEFETKIRRRFPPAHQKHLQFYTTDKTACEIIPAGSCNFVFSWDTFVFFNLKHIEQYLTDIKRVLIPGGYCFIQYADCHYDIDLEKAKRGYWAYNTKTAMTQIIEKCGYKVIEMNQFRPGANYAIFQNPGKQNPVVYKVSELTLD